jgi:pimeloyl-ACP methyl ester carboxylesterase
MAQAHVNGITIEYEVHGAPDGDPLLLVMGLGGQLIAWPIEFVDALTALGFRVIRFDNRDIGLSTKIDAPPPTKRQMILGVVAPRFAKSTYTLGDMADDAAALLEHLDVERAHVVGASMGGMIAQSIAINHPERVASLTSIMSNTGDRRHGKVSPKLLRKLPKLLSRGPDDAIRNAVAVSQLTAGAHFDRALAEQAATAAFERSYDPAGAARQTMAIAASPDRTEALGSVTAPTLVIHGLADRLVRPSGGIATAKAVGDSRLVMYPDMGHDLPRARWEEIIGEIAVNAARAKAVVSSSAAPSSSAVSATA